MIERWKHVHAGNTQQSAECEKCRGNQTITLLVHCHIKIYNVTALQAYESSKLLDHKMDFPSFKLHGASRC
ncbi:Hypothetical predicted protein [Podarcis lilfordi]|uniref:Uncharacterized protein n=1 Tax=Podarcis lilfordi TaxID=74358 RepID=A0AA35P6Y9_9SAUR|nr:Hypothetical predicted protein [Podarcis lilfordi]